MIRRMKACLNGGRTGPHVPVTPAQLARAATGAVAAGAEAVHLHPRAATGRESLAAADIGAAVTAVRAAGVPIGVSTGSWITGGDARRRLALIEGWAALPDRPDFASVNVGEDGYDDLMQALTARGIGVEAGVWRPAEADRAGAGRRGLPTRIGLEDTLTGPDGALAADNAVLVRAAIAVWDAAQVQ